MTRLVLALVFLTGCGRVVYYDVAPYQEPCLCGEAHTTCLLARESGDFEPMCFGIDGYEHEWGLASSLEVSERSISNPPMDGSSIERELLDVIDETPAEPGDEFTLRFMGDLDDMGYAEVVDYSTDGERCGQIIGGPEFIAEPVSVCDDMIALDETDHVAFAVTFHFGDPVDGPLVATSAVAE